MDSIAVITELADQGVKVSLSREGRLQIKAPKGVLTAEVKGYLADNKESIIQFLFDSHDDKDNETLTQISPDKINRYQPFPMADLQTGFYMADHDFMEFHVRPHYYMERDYDELDIARFERAWNLVFQYHKGSIAILDENDMMQPLEEIPPYHIEICDLRDMSNCDARLKLQEIRGSMERTQLPLHQWPWFDMKVSIWTEVGHKRYRVHLNNNNFFTDGYSVVKLWQLAERFYSDPGQQLSPPEITFRDCVLALGELSQSTLGKAAKQYWHDRLDELPAAPPVPQISSKERRCASHLKRRNIVFDENVWLNFKEYAKRNGLTPTNAVAAVYAEVLSYWSNSPHFILIQMVTRRLPMHNDIFDVLGNFSSVYPVEVDFRNGYSFAERARTLQKQNMLDISYLHWGGMDVMQELSRRNGATGRTPSPFVFSSGLFMGPVARPDYACLETSQTLLDHQFWETQDGKYFAVWDVLEEFFPKGVIDAMWKAYEELLMLLGTDESAWGREQFDLVPLYQLQQRKKVNTVAGEVPGGYLHSNLPVMAQNYPDKIAVVHSSGTFSYAELFDYTCKIAHRLSVLGARPNQLIGVLAEKGWQQVVGALGVVSSGAAYVPISPSFPQERIRKIVEKSGIKVLVTQAKFADLAKCFVTEPVIIEDEQDGCIQGYEFTPVQKETDLAYVIYTSGSTGEPKGVMINHRACLNTVVDINRRFNITGEDVIFGISAFTFDLSVYDVFGAIEAGSTLVLPDAIDVQNPLAWIESVLAEKVTVWNSTPAIVQLLIEAINSKGIQVDSLRRIMMSGDWIPLTLPGEIKQGAPRADIISLGGATEASIWSIYYPVDEVKAEWQSVPYGYPLASQPWYVLNEKFQPCPDFVSGDLYIGGVGLADGYWEDPDKTGASFVTHPLTGERLYKTGDLGCYHPEGWIEFLGRKDFQVKIQGFRIELGEIEAHLAGHAAVNEAVVVAKDDGKKGKRLVAYVVEVEGEKGVVQSDDLRSYLESCLPDYMVPSSLHILEQIPLSANGKVDRKALISFEDMEEGREREFVAPRNDLEQAICKVWMEVLELNRIGIHDDFFEIGGQSFSAIRVASRLAEQFEVSLAIRNILENRTIDALAQFISEGTETNVGKRLLVDIYTKAEGQKLFFVHPAGGNVLCYQALANTLKQPFYGLQAAGLEGECAPCDDLEHMAQRYVAEIRKVQTQGPYVMGGWSSGGMIAFEMARQLEASGQVVSRIMMFDSPAPTQNEPVNDATLLLWFLEDLNIGFPLEQLSITELQSIDPAMHFVYLTEKVDVQHELPAGITLDNLKVYFEVFKGIVRAGRKYTPQMISADILLLRAGEGRVSEFADHPDHQDVEWGWNRLTTGKVTAKFCPGTHYTLLTPPNLYGIVEHMNARTVALCLP